MVKCSACGKAIDKMPNWLQSVNVGFVCNNCPKRQGKMAAMVAEAARSSAMTEERARKMDDFEDEESESESD